MIVRVFERAAAIAVLLLIISVPVFVSAQSDNIATKGIDFDRKLSWPEALQKAKIENKFIFIDCFTTWWAPCKEMAANVFSRGEVGSFFNSNFINLSVQMDQTDHDDEYTRNWFVDAERIYENYKITGFPTLLFFSPEGKVVFRIEGARDATGLLSAGSFAIQPSKDYNQLIDLYSQGNRDTIVTKNLALIAKSKGDPKFAHKVAQDYINTLNNPLTKENIDFIAQFTDSLVDKGFEIFNKYPHEIANIMQGSKYYAIDRALHIIQNYDSNFTTIVSQKVKTPNWSLIQKNLSKLYNPEIVRKTIDDYKVRFYEKNNCWDKYVPAIIFYINTYYPEKTFTKGLEYYCWNMFLHSNDKPSLQIALSWAERILIFGLKDGYNIDTYASLLYKLGRRQEAIFLEEKAVDLVDNNDKKDFRLRLNKMIKGQKTW